MTIEFGPFNRAEGLEQQRALFDNAFSENAGLSASTREHYEWKFYGSPSSPQSYEYVATENGRMLGYYAAIPYPYCIAGRELLVGMVCDVMTHSDARGRGVFTELGKYSLEQLESTDLAFVTGYPIRAAVMGGHLRVGWQVAFELPMYLRVLKSDAILRSKRLGWLAPVANLFTRGYQALVGRGRRPAHLTCTSGAPEALFGTDMFASFLERWKDTVPNHLAKSQAFYRWRLGAPGTAYRAFTVFDRGEIVAAAIGREATLQGIPSFALLDVMALEGGRGLASLYDEIDREAQRRAVEAVVTMMSRHSARRYHLVRHGFVKSPFKFKLIVRAVGNAVGMDALTREADWHLMWIDSDDL